MHDMCLVSKYIKSSLSFTAQWLLYAPSALALKALPLPHTVYYVFHMIHRINGDYYYNRINQLLL